MNDKLEGDRYARIVHNLRRLLEVKEAALKTQGYHGEGWQDSQAARADAAFVLHMLHDSIVHVATISDPVAIETTTDVMLSGLSPISELGTERRQESDSEQA